MKKQIMLSFLFCAVFLRISSAQIEEEQKSMNLGINNAIVLELPNSEAKLVEKVWRKFVGQYGSKAKKVRKTDEWLSAGANFSGESCDIYSSIDKSSGGGSVVNVWVDLESEFLSSTNNPSVYLEVEKMLEDFTMEVRKEEIQLELQEEEKKLKKLENSLKRLERANDGYHKDIENAKERIKKAEENIEKNLREQENARMEIATQEELIEQVKNRLKDF